MKTPYQIIDNAGIPIGFFRVKEWRDEALKLYCEWGFPRDIENGNV